MRKLLKILWRIFAIIIGLILQIALLFNLLNVYKNFDPPEPGIVKSNRLNVVWILAEDLSPDLPAYGDSTVQTPNLDRLAEEGVVYDLAFTTQPICAPSKSCLYTGQYQTYLGTHQMRTSWKNYEAVPPPETKVFTEYLRQEGYYCSKSGHADYQFGTAPTAWDKFSPGFFTFQRIRHWRDRSDNQPFFASIDLGETHESGQWMKPFAKPTVNLETVKIPPYYVDDPVIRKDIAIMYTNIAKMDVEVGKILDKLEVDGLTENTVVVFMGDHGRGLPRSKRWLYDGGLKVPMIIRWPGVLEPGSRSQQMVSFVDMAPTMLSILGFEIPGHMQGKAFMGKGANTIPREYIFGSRDRADEAVDKLRAVRNNRYKYIINYLPDSAWTQALWFRDMMPLMKRMRELNDLGKLTGGSAYWFAPSKPEEELYDTWKDPHEISNLALNTEYDSIKSVLKSELRGWIDQYDRYFDVVEEDMIQQMWPDRIQPTTATPEIVTKPLENRNYIVSIHCQTNGASIEYRINKNNIPKQWKIYNEAITLDPPFKIETRALRYGYTMSEKNSIQVKN